MIELRRPIDARQVWLKVPPTNKRADMAVPYQELAEVEEKAKAYTDATIRAVPPPTPQSIGAIPLSEKGAANGVPILGGDSKVPLAQLTLPVPSQIGAIESSQKGSPGGVASLDANAKVPLAQIPQSVLDRITTLEAQVATLRASQQTPTPTPTPTPTENVVYTFDYAALISSKFAPSGSGISFDSANLVVRNGGNYSGLNSTMSAGVSLQAGSYRLICNCRIESGSSHQIYWGSGGSKLVKTISNTSFADVSLEFSLATAVNNFSPFGEENHSGGSIACFIKSFRIVKIS